MIQDELYHIRPASWAAHFGAATCHLSERVARDPSIHLRYPTAVSPGGRLRSRVEGGRRHAAVNSRMG